MTEIISIINQKGGSAKTTTAVNVSYALADLGKKILLLDLDPQANASKRLGASEYVPNINNVLLNKKTEAEKAVYPAKAKDKIINRLFVLPASSDRELAATAELMLAKPRREEILSRIINRNKNVFSVFDYVIIDTNPALNVLTMNAMLVADRFIIPATGSTDSYDGSWQALETIMELHDLEEYEQVNYRILRCDIDRRASSIVQLSEKLSSAHGDKKQFRDYIPRSVKFEKSVALNQPVAALYPNSPEANNYKSIAQEIINGD
ncbi:Chromosome-partitioning ATPase Soj [invertebrate metagenome]|uniref:Chromosome-partitioning ATPase Soj n=1 Tax=invertebrate metagenome TaxID=1711999 RepID=A0A2H9T3M1_9ZZZZ